MKAGRDLDALVAEKVMEWEPKGLHPIFATPLYHQTKPFHADNLLPRFSTDLSAAFQVVAKLHECIAQEEYPWARANYLTLSCRGLNDGWAAAFTCVDGKDEWHETPERFGGARGSTAAEAICLAALRAVGVGVGQ